MVLYEVESSKPSCVYPDPPCINIKDALVGECPVFRAIMKEMEMKEKRVDYRGVDFFNMNNASSSSLSRMNMGNINIEYTRGGTTGPNIIGSNNK